MSTRRRSRLDRGTVEQLLRGEPTGLLAGWPAGPEELTGLLAAAAAPARRHELAGEQEARVAFRAARLNPTAQPRRCPMITTSLARLLTLKAAAAAAAAFAAGGIALAAGTGHLPIHSGAPAAHTSTLAKGTPSPTAHHPVHTAMPSTAFYGLCRAYTARVSTSPGKALQNPAFTALIAAAGGTANVNAFCAAILKTGPGHTAAHQKGKSAAHPTGNPSTHPGGGPSSHPTGEPPSLPTPTHPSH